MTRKLTREEKIRRDITRRLNSMSDELYFPPYISGKDLTRKENAAKAPAPDNNQANSSKRQS